MRKGFIIGFFVFTILGFLVFSTQLTSSGPESGTFWLVLLVSSIVSGAVGGISGALVGALIGKFSKK